MVYPSGWTPGSFGYAYPPEHPGPVVRMNVQATVDRIEEAGPRRWCVPGYRISTTTSRADWVTTPRKFTRRSRATAEAGGIGFMLWDPSLQYEQQALEQALSLTWSPFG